MPRKHAIEVQGHRGARGLKPENTLPSFEVAFDLGISGVETDVRLTADGVTVLFHDETLSDKLCRIARGSKTAIDFNEEPLVSSFTLAELRGLIVDRNPDPKRFPRQNNDVTPVAEMYAAKAGIDPYGIPTLGDLFAFARAYAGEMGKKAGKTPTQRKRAAQIRFEVEIKRVAYVPEAIGDDYTGRGAGLLERKLVEEARRWRVTRRTVVRSFDHRAVRAVRKLEGAIRGALLIVATTPVSPYALCRAAGATVYCPDYKSIDPALIRQAHAKAIKIIPWNISDGNDLEKLLAWGVDGVATDFPDQVIAWLAKQRVEIV